MGSNFPHFVLTVDSRSRIFKTGALVVLCLLFFAFFSGLTKKNSDPSNIETIRVVMDDNYPPYTFLDKNGNPQGILIDEWRLWEQKTGIKVEISTMKWEKAIQEMKAGKFDVIDTAFMNAERLEYLDFSAPYTDIEVPIYFKNNISGLTDAASLKGFKVGVKKQDYAVSYLRTQGIEEFLEFDSYESIIQAARNHQVLVFVIDKPPAEYFINKYGIQSEFNSSSPLYTGQFHRAVKKGNLTLLNTVESGFKQISSLESNTINVRWLGSPMISPQNSRYLLIGAGFISFCALLLLFSNRILQQRVSDRTRELNALFEAMQDLVLVIDTNGFFLDLPIKSREKIPLLNRKIVGKHVKDLIPDKSGENVLNVIKNVLSTQKPEISEYTVSIDGKTSWFSGVISPLDKKRALLVSRDFTQWKNTQEALIESEHRFHIMFENHDVAMVLISPENNQIVDLNQSAADFYGYTIEQMRKLKLDEIDEFSDWPIQSMTNSFLGEGQTKFVQTLQLSNGETRVVEIHATPVQIKKENLVFCIILDITERKKAEEAVQHKSIELANAYEATLEGWSNALELRERETAGHSKRVVELTLQICRMLGLPEHELTHIQRGALLHDIGKMGIPDNILLKPGPLSSDEWVIMRQHPLYAYQLLSRIPFLQPALDIPYAHHERWDGSGYPRGLKGEEIPLPARIFAVVDVWDALISDRPYRPAWTKNAAFNYLKENSGKLFDPQIVAAFEKIYQDQENSSSFK